MNNQELHTMDLLKSISSQEQIEYLKQLLADTKKDKDNAISNEASIQRITSR